MVQLIRARGYMQRRLTYSASAATTIETGITDTASPTPEPATTHTEPRSPIAQRGGSSHQIRHPQRCILGLIDHVLLPR